MPSASGTEVEILAPEVYLLLHDSPLNGGKLKTALVLLDHGQTVFEQRLPDHTADSENLSYRLFVADANRYGILTTESHSNFIRFRLLEDGALSEGFSVQGDLTGYAALLGWLCNLSWEGGTYTVTMGSESTDVTLESLIYGSGGMGGGMGGQPGGNMGTPPDGNGGSMGTPPDGNSGGMGTPPDGNSGKGGRPGQ